MSSRDVTHLLEAMEKGDEKAMHRLFSIVYGELHNVAHRALRDERPDHTFNTTALVHETYLQMVHRPPEVEWGGKRHFLGVAARAMRQILVNHAKATKAQKRGGSWSKLQFNEREFVPAAKPDELIALDEALDRLGKLDERQARMVECRYFAGLTIDETASLLGVSRATVNRDWTSARLWLNREVKNIMAGTR